jgi:hypothetical protein
MWFNSFLQQPVMSSCLCKYGEGAGFPFQIESLEDGVLELLFGDVPDYLPTREKLLQRQVRLLLSLEANGEVAA